MDSHFSVKGISSAAFTYSNKGDAKLDAESFQAARQSLMSLKNEKGTAAEHCPECAFGAAGAGKGSAYDP